jgi:uncharacterized protein (DUF1330 family)
VSANPHFLIVKWPGGAQADLAPFAAACAAAGGVVLAQAGADAVEALEKPTTRHGALLIARFAHGAELDAAWAARPHDPPAGAQALAAPGLPWEGWPGEFVPTIATVDVPSGDGPRAFMLIEGTGTDEAAMDAYRAIIMPMLRERGAWYPAFEFGGGVRALHGSFEWAFLAISRWPDIGRARDFWYCDRYQQVAIPARTGAGSFEVQLCEGQAG